MSLHHATSGEIIDIHPLGSKLSDTPSTALLKSDQLEIMRLVLAAGKEIPEHNVPGEITLQCLEGKVEVRAHGKTQTLSANELVLLAGNVPYSLRGVENCSVLMTIVLTYENGKAVAGSLPQSGGR